MDIYSAELQVKRLLAYVQDLANSSHKMYGKSKTRLKDVASTCSEVIRVIYNILEEESLCNIDEVEFATSSNSDISNMLNDIQSGLNKLKSFIATPSATTVPTQMSTPSRKQVISDYEKVFQSLALKHLTPSSAGQCAELLHNWFLSRFSVHNGNFHYNIKRLSDWVRDIVIMYGYHLSCGTEAEFILKFNEWCDSIQSDTTITYAVPYCIYNFNRFHESSQFTLTAVVLWDILLDNGLAELCTESDDLYPAEDSVYKLCGEYNPSVLDDYVDYKLNPSLLKHCNLIKE